MIDGDVTATDAAVGDQLHRVVDQLSREDASEALGYLRWMLDDEEETLTEEEWARVRKAEDDMSRGEYVTFEEFKRSLVQ
jgi:hypothetical protein